MDHGQSKLSETRQGREQCNICRCCLEMDKSLINRKKGNAPAVSTADCSNDTAENVDKRKIHNAEKSIDILDAKSCTFTADQVDKSSNQVRDTIDLSSETDEPINSKHTDQVAEIEQQQQSSGNEQSNDASQSEQSKANTTTTNKGDSAAPKAPKRNIPQEFTYENPALLNYFQSRLLQTILLFGGTKELLGEWDIEISRRYTGMAAGILKVVYKCKNPTKVCKSRNEILWSLGIFKISTDIDRSLINRVSGFFIAVERRERNLLSLQLELSKDQCANVTYIEDNIKVTKPPKASNVQQESNDYEQDVEMDTGEAGPDACAEADDAQEATTEMQEETNDAQMETDTQTKDRQVKTSKSAKAPGVLYNRWARKRFLCDFPELGKRRESYKANNSPQPNSQPSSQPSTQKLGTNDIIIHIHGNYGILSWGSINFSVDGNNKVNYHCKNEIYPIGFKCIIIERDVICNKIVTLLLEILEVELDGDSVSQYCSHPNHKKKVQFKITAVWNTDERAVYVGDTPADVWTAVMSEKKYIPEKRLTEYEKLLVHSNKQSNNASESEAPVDSKETPKQSDATVENENLPDQPVAPTGKTSSTAEESHTTSSESNTSTNTKQQFIFRRFYIDYADQNLLVQPGVMRLIEGMAGSLDCENFFFKQHEGDISTVLKEFQTLQSYVKLLEKIGTRVTYIGEFYPIVPLLPYCPSKKSNGNPSSGSNLKAEASSNRNVAKNPSASKKTNSQSNANGASNKSRSTSEESPPDSSDNPKQPRNSAPRKDNNDKAARKAAAPIVDAETIAMRDAATAMRHAAIAEIQARRNAIQAANEQAKLQNYRAQIANQKVRDIQTKLKLFFTASHTKFTKQVQRASAAIDRLHEAEYNHIHVYTGLRNDSQEAKASIPLPVVISNSAACPAHVIDKVIQIYLFLTSYQFYNQDNIHAIKSIPSIDSLIELVIGAYSANSRSPDIEIVPTAENVPSAETGLVGGCVATTTILQIFEKICMALAVPLIPKFEKHVGIAVPTPGYEDDKLKIPINIYTWREIIRVVLLGEACDSFGLSLRDEQIELLVKGGYDDCFHEVEFMEKKMVKYARRKIQANANTTSSILLDAPVAPNKYNSWLELLNSINIMVDPYQIYNTIASSIKLIDSKQHKIIEVLNTAISPAVFDVKDCSLTKQIVLKVAHHFSEGACIVESEPNISITDLYCRKEASSMLTNSKRFMSNEDAIETAMDLDNEVENEEKLVDVNDEALQALPVPLKRCYEVLTYLTRHALGRNVIKKIYKANTLCAKYSNFKMTFEDVKSNILTAAYRNPDSYVADFYVDVYSIFDHLYYFTSPEGSVNHDLIVKLCNLFIQLIRSHVLCTHTPNPVINSYCLVCHEAFNGVDSKKNLYCERCGGSHHASCVYDKNSSAKKGGKEKEDWYCSVCTASDKKSFAFSTHPYRKATVRHPTKGEVYGQVSDIIYLNTNLQFIVEFPDESSFIWSIETVVKYLVSSFYSLPAGMSHLDYNRTASLLYGCDSSTYIPLPVSMHSNLSTLLVGSHTAFKVRMELFEKAQVALGVYGDYNSCGSDTIEGYINIILAIIPVLLQFPNAIAEMNSQSTMYEQKINECAQIIHKKDKDTLFSDRFFLDSPETKACMTKSLDDIVQNNFRLASDKERDVIYVDADYVSFDAADISHRKESEKPETEQINVTTTSGKVDEDIDPLETVSEDSNDSDDSFIMQINEECAKSERIVIDLTADRAMNAVAATPTRAIDSDSQRLLNQYISRKNGIETALSTQNILLELFCTDNLHAVIYDIRDILEKSVYHFVKFGGETETVQLELPVNYVPSPDGYTSHVATEIVNYIMLQIIPVSESMQQKLDYDEWFLGFDSVMKIFEANNYSSGTQVCCLCKESECSAVSPLIYGETYDEWLRFEYSLRDSSDSRQSYNSKSNRLWIPCHESYRCDIHDRTNSCYDRDIKETDIFWDLRDGSMVCHERCMEQLHTKRLRAFREMQRHHLIEFIETYTRLNFNSSRLVPFGVDHNNNMYFYINGSTSLYVYCSSVSFYDKSLDKKDSIESKLQKGFANYITPEYTSGATNRMHWFVYEHLGDIGRVIQYLRRYCDVSANNRKLEKILCWLYPHAIRVAEEESERFEQVCNQQLQRANAVVNSNSSTSNLPHYTVKLPKHVPSSSAQCSEESSNAQWNNAYRFLALPSCLVQLNASPRIIELINFDSSPTSIFLIECVRHLYEQPECPMRTLKLVLMAIFKALPNAAFDLSMDDTWPNVNMFQDSFIRGVYHAPSAAVLADFAIILETAIKPAYISDDADILNTLPCRTRLLYQPIYSALLYRLFCLDQILKYKST